MSKFTIPSPYPGVLRATFEEPPIHLLHEHTLEQISALADRLESELGIEVLVIESVNPGFPWHATTRPERVH